jgi:hypothetical protein
MARAIALQFVDAPDACESGDGLKRGVRALRRRRKKLASAVGEFTPRLSRT